MIRNFLKLGQTVKLAFPLQLWYRGLHANMRSKRTLCQMVLILVWSTAVIKLGLYCALKLVQTIAIHPLHYLLSALLSGSIRYSMYPDTLLRPQTNSQKAWHSTPVAIAKVYINKTLIQKYALYIFINAAYL